MWLNDNSLNRRSVLVEPMFHSTVSHFSNNYRFRLMREIK